MKKYVNIFLMASLIAMSQTPQTLNLQGCIDLAIQNNLQLKNSKIDERIASAKVGETRAIGLPKVDAQAQLAHNNPLQPIFYKNSSAGFFPFDAGAGEGAIKMMPNFFQLPSSLNLSFSASWLALNASYFVGLKAAKTYTELSVLNTNLTKATIVQDVSKAYYLTLVTIERYEQLNGSLARLDSTYKEVKALNQAGFAEKLDVERLEVTLNNLKAEMENVKGFVDLSYAILKIQLGLAQSQEIVVSEKLQDYKESLTKVQPQTPNYEARIEYQSLLKSQKLYELDNQNVRLSPLPSLVLFANGGTITSNTEVPKLFQSSSPWGKYLMYGATVQLSVFGSGTKYYKYQQTKLNLEKTKNGIEATKLNIDLQIKNAEINLNNALTTVEIRKKNLDLANSVVKQAKAKYKAGVGSNLELTTAEAELRNAQSEYYVALGDALSSKVDYDYAIGNLK